MHIEMQVTKAL